MKTAGVILNGGQSSRMGQNKSQLEIGGISLLQHTKNKLIEAGLTDVFVSGPGGMVDRYPKAGPLAGIHSALHELQAYQALLFLPVDMPLIKAAMLSELLLYNGADLTHYQGEHFPLLIKNTSLIRDQVCQQIENNDLAIHQLIKLSSGFTVTHSWPDTCFSNTNTEQQWRAVIGLLNH